MRYVFDPEKRGAFFRLNADGTDFGKAQRVKRGDPVELSDEMAAKVRDNFGPRCLRPEGAVVVDGKGGGVVARPDFDRMQQERDFYRLAARALARSAADRKDMAVAVGAAVNADADAQRTALLTLPESLADALDAMLNVAKDWA